MPNFKIADLVLQLNTEDAVKDEIATFLLKEEKEIDMNIQFNACDSLNEPEDLIFLDENIGWYSDPEYKNSNSFCLFYNTSEDVIATMHIDTKIEEAHINYIGNSSDYLVMLGPLGELLLHNKILMHQGLFVHAVVMEWEGKGILFTAPSGTGKSTQADLWKHYMGATVINGDRAVIRMIEKEPYVYGSPWCGSSNQFLNKRVPLDAIVILEQASENMIQKLDPKEAFLGLFTNSFLPYYNDNGEMMSLALETLENIILTTSVYRLCCRPDKEAVDLVHACVK